MCVGVGNLYAAQAPNPRGASHSDVRSDVRSGVRGDGSSANVVSRGATNRSVVSNGRGTAARTAVAPARATTARTATNTKVVAIPKRTNATNVRSAVPATTARSAVAGVKTGRNSGNIKITKAGLGRAARATAVFSDISKIGGGYGQCRDSYATCMDQFCANANDTYRRCFCSGRFTEFRDTELALGEAKVLLQKFEDNNLNAVDKTAAEVNAMYTATIGEAAIKNDVSGAQSILNEIGDLLSGKKKAGQQQESQTMDLGSLDFTVNIDDIWGSSNSMFDSGGRSGPNMAELEGKSLYNEASKQCLELTSDACTSSAVLNMATSAYDIMITQDCNLYEKKIDSQREAVMKTVREAEKILREARLEEYRSHNSADVNECITKVKAAILQDTACGEDYKRCLDYSGVYVNQTTGEPIYSPRLFEMNKLIELEGATGNLDVLGQNKAFNDFLDSKRVFAETALDSCRGIADTAWTEFKRTALIEIAQAQDEKIEEVKNSCVETMAECYDAQSGALKSFDNTKSQYTGALSVAAAKNMCQDKVTACAALYGNNTACKIDGNGKITNPKECGVGELLTFVDTVDTIKMNEGCAEALTNYVTKDLCVPLASEANRAYPWGCRNLSQEDLRSSIMARAKEYCVNVPDTGCEEEINSTTFDSSSSDCVTVNNLIENVKSEMSYMFSDECTNLGGIWIDNEDGAFGAAGNYVSTVNIGGTGLTEFYLAMNAGTMQESEKSIGIYGNCYQNSVKTQCELYGTDSGATYNETTGQCDFDDTWYEAQCALLGGYFEGNTCYYDKESQQK